MKLKSSSPINCYCFKYFNVVKNEIRIRHEICFRYLLNEFIPLLPLLDEFANKMYM